MTLYESTEGLEKYESAGIEAYMDPRVYAELGKLGDINVDFVTNQFGQSGFKIAVGNGDCADSGCRGC